MALMKYYMRIFLFVFGVYLLMALSYMAGTHEQSGIISSLQDRIRELKNAANQERMPQPPVVGSSALHTKVEQRQPGSEVLKMFNLVNMTEVWMDPNEVLLVLKYLRGAKTYLEWGSGGTTLNLPQFVSERAVSIEHDKDWCEAMPKRLAEKKVRTVEFHCIHVNHKNSEGTYAMYRSYINEITNLNQSTWDFVLIDGRARVSAAIRALSFVRDDSTVVIHDFERVHDLGQATYRTVLKYYDVMDRFGESVKHGSSPRGIGILRRKAKLRNLQGNHNAVLAILEAGSKKKLF